MKNKKYLGLTLAVAAATLFTASAFADTTASTTDKKAPAGQKERVDQKGQKVPDGGKPEKHSCGQNGCNSK